MYRLNTYIETNIGILFGINNLWISSQRNIVYRPKGFTGTSRRPTVEYPPDWWEWNKNMEFYNAINEIKSIYDLRF